MLSENQERKYPFRVMDIPKDFFSGHTYLTYEGTEVSQQQQDSQRTSTNLIRKGQQVVIEKDRASSPPVILRVCSRQLNERGSSAENTLIAVLVGAPIQESKQTYKKGSHVKTGLDKLSKIRSHSELELGTAVGWDVIQNAA